MGKTKKENSNVNKGIGCLTIFGGVFALTGLAVGVMAFINISNWWDARDWESVPATVLSATLRVSHGDDSTTYEAEAQYRYQFKNIDLTSTTSSGNKRYYDIVATLVDNRKLKLAHTLLGKRDAQALVDKFKQILGLNSDISE